MTADADDLTDPGGEAYTPDACPWWGQPLPSIDRWSDGSFHCSRCGRSTVVVDGERRHAPPPVLPAPTPGFDRAAHELVGHVIEFHVPGHGPRLGMVDNIPERRVFARVDHVGADGGSAAGFLVCYDPDGVRMVISPDRPVVDWGIAEAGWARLARNATTTQEA